MAKKPYILGVDPGIHGACSVINPEMGQSGLVNVWDFPLMENGSKKMIDHNILALQMAAIITDCEFAIIEDVHSFPRDGHVGAFTFGKNTGIIWGMIAALMVPIYTVPPAVWKMSFGLSSDKNESRELATKKYPFHGHLWAKKKQDGRAEAILLAEFGKRFY